MSKNWTSRVDPDFGIFFDIRKKAKNEKGGEKSGPGGPQGGPSGSKKGPPDIDRIARGVMLRGFCLPGAGGKPPGTGEMRN